MPTPTYIPIATTTLTASAASVTFGSIPQDYRDLVLICDFVKTASSSTDNFLRFNDDASGYTRVSAFVDVSGVFSNSNSSSKLSFYANGDDVTIVQIMDYSATDKHKTFLARYNTPNSTGDFRTLLGMIAGRFASTNAVTSVKFDVGAATISSGSTFSLYGIAS